MKLVTARSMQLIDREAIDNGSIPGSVLMENAGKGIAEALLDDIIKPSAMSAVAIFCGKGNNGGDGMVIARYLHEASIKVTVYFPGPSDKLSDDSKLNYDRAREAGVRLIEISDQSDLPDSLECQLIVDAIFGTGFEGAPRGLMAAMIEKINEYDITVASVDLPSGLNADTGKAEGVVIDADCTYSLALPKYGTFVSPGREYAGRVAIVPIGIPDSVIDKFDLNTDLIDADEVAALLPRRKPDGHKGDFGRLLLLAGSLRMTGAAALAADSALRSGCGLCKIACPASVLPILAAKTTEPTTHPLQEIKKKGVLALRALGDLRRITDEQSAVIIGPGIGRHHETMELVRRYLSSLSKPSIVDADALYALSGHTEILTDQKGPKAQRGPMALTQKGSVTLAQKAPKVLTPHGGEFARLTGKKTPDDIHERLKDAREFVADKNIVLVLKGSPTIVVERGGRAFVNPTGNSGMATGGSGDVLSGIIGSFLAQGMSAIDAAVCGVYLHGLAGDLAARDLTERALVASDIISYLSEAFQMVEA